MKRTRIGTVGVVSCTRPYSYQAAKAEPRLDAVPSTLSTGIANVSEYKTYRPNHDWRYNRWYPIHVKYFPYWALVYVEDSIGYLASADFKLLELLSRLRQNALNTRNDPSSTCEQPPLHFIVNGATIQGGNIPADTSEKASVQKGFNWAGHYFCEEICRSESRNGAERERKKRGEKSVYPSEKDEFYELCCLLNSIFNCITSARVALQKMNEVVRLERKWGISVHSSPMAILGSASPWLKCHPSSTLLPNCSEIEASRKSHRELTY